jgi:hypothetical protein
MENQTSVVGNVAPVSKPPKAPEIGLFYSLLLTPIAGAIFWSMNWKRLGRPQHRWWTWVTAIVVLILDGICLAAGSAWVGLIIIFAWDILMFALQKKITPTGIRSITAWVFVVILAIIEVGAVFVMHTGTQSVSAGVSADASVTVGTSYDKNSPTLSVSGTKLQPNEKLYARIYSPTQFGTTSLTFLLQKQDGSGWQQVVNQPVSVAPNYDVLVEPFFVTQPGTYQIEAVNPT